jgi:hypothetical protein
MEYPQHAAACRAACRQTSISSGGDERDHASPCPADRSAGFCPPEFPVRSTPCSARNTIALTHGCVVRRAARAFAPADAPLTCDYGQSLLGGHSAQPIHPCRTGADSGAARTGVGSGSGGLPDPGDRHDRARSRSVHRPRVERGGSCGGSGRHPRREYAWRSGRCRHADRGCGEPGAHPGLCVRGPPRDLRRRADLGGGRLRVHGARRADRRVDRRDGGRGKGIREGAERHARAVPSDWRSARRWSTRRSPSPGSWRPASS